MIIIIINMTIMVGITKTKMTNMMIYEHDDDDNGQVQGATQEVAGAVSSLQEERGTFNVERNGELDQRESVISFTSSSSSSASSS